MSILPSACMFLFFRPIGTVVHLISVCVTCPYRGCCFSAGICDIFAYYYLEIFYPDITDFHLSFKKLFSPGTKILGHASLDSAE